MQLCDDIKIFLSLKWQPKIAILIIAINRLKLGQNLYIPSHFEDLKNLVADISYFGLSELMLQLNNDWLEVHK